MPISFTCPHCRYTFDVEDRYVGQTGPCAACGKTITVADASDSLAPYRPAGARGSTRSGPLVALLLALVGLVFLVVFVVVLVFLAIPATQMVQSSANLKACETNLIRIGQAMLAYHEDFGSFPPAYVADSDGKPAHSWRVLLLPYLGHQALYDQYNFGKPHNDPINVFLASQMPAVYACPDDLNAPGSETSYVVVSGKGLAFDGAGNVSRSQITDGPANTILVVEMASGAVAWTEPRDLNVSTMTLSINTGAANEIGSHHAGGGANVLLADGTVRFLDSLIPPGELEALLTIDKSDAPQ